MKKVVVLLLSIFVLSEIQAQDTLAKSKKSKKDWSKVSLAYRPKDHLLLQIGYNHWMNEPDSIQDHGLPLSYNFYLLFDFPFKGNPRFSVALGAGVGFDNKGFEYTYIDITGQKANRLSFMNVKDTNHFKKYKMVNSYLEVPVELRFSSNPEKNMKSWKAAIGFKVGTMVGAGTRGKELQNRFNTTINDYVMKERAKRFFNTTRLSVMARFGYSFVSIYACYNVNEFIKQGFGPDVRPLQVGLTFSGL